MSLDDIKAIDWKNPDPRKWPTYLQIGFSVMLLGIILFVIGVLI